MEEIMNLSVDQIILLNELVLVAKEAKEVSQMIHQAYKNAFDIGEDKVKVWSDDCNAEYLTHEGVWQARYLYQTYDIKCSPDEIYPYFRAEYLIQNGYAEEYTSNGAITEEGRLKQIAGYFRSFVRRAQEKPEAQA